MVSAGIDIGSRTVKVVLFSKGKVIKRISETTFAPLSVCKFLLKDYNYDRITATGYGRYLFKEHFECEIISEIKAFALGARVVNSACRTILDIGGQDIKVISLDQEGNMQKFEMNDRCAAGTGRFLEIMAMALGCSIQDFGSFALTAESATKLNSMCTVFAESEVISLLSKGTPRNEIALGIHKSIIGRVKSMLQRVSLKNDLIFAGGASLNNCLIKLIEREVGMKISIPDNPQMIGALGCAINGLDNKLINEYIGKMKKHQ
ncbi:MAG: 3-hydroxyacyl-ACP dehydratase [FCB group bacterium]|nr:3-hydroxyacyl-ACP dehydratase [FCB group bacterium]